MMFRFLSLASAAALASASGVRVLQGQPSAKFAAAWSDEMELAGTCINTDNQDMIDFWGTSPLNDLSWCDTITGGKDADFDLAQFAPMGLIKIPNDKEILITLSAQIDILTINTATSKGGNKANPDPEDYLGNIGATSASAGITVELFAQAEGQDPVQCFPGKVTMASRYVEVRNQVGAEVTYEDCVIVEGEEICTNKLADTTVVSTIGVAMDTAAAHSFQWVCADMESATYNIYAAFSLTSEVNNLCDDSNFGDCDSNADLAAARVILNKRMMTIQQVRAVKDAFPEI